MQNSQSCIGVCAPAPYIGVCAPAYIGVRRVSAEGVRPPNIDIALTTALLEMSPPTTVIFARSILII